jgi:hypothetical protein
MVSAHKLTMLGAGLIALEMLATTAQAQKTEDAAKLPDSVRKAFQARFPKAQIVKVDAEEENGVKVYDVEFTDGGIAKETDIAADGTVLEVTVVVEPRSVPYAAMYAIRNAAPDGRVKRIEKVEASYETKDGKAVKLAKPQICFEAEVTRGNQVAEVVVSPDGKILKPAKWNAEKAEASQKK